MKKIEIPIKLPIDSGSNLHLIAELYSIRLERKKLKTLDKTTEEMYNDLVKQQEDCRKQLHNIRKNLKLLDEETTK